MHNEEKPSINNRGTSKPCLNCDTVLLADASHCHHCGQAIKEARMTVRGLFSDFFSNLFNLDGKIWRTLRYMWKPAYLAKEYVSGRRMRYFNPARFFAVNLILHFLLLTYTMSYSELRLDTIEDVAGITKSELLTQYDTIATSLIPSADSLEIDTLRSALFGDAKPVDEDTLFSNVKVVFSDMSGYGILKKDAYSLSPEELYEKYEITDRWHRLFIRQTIRINMNKESTLTYIIGNLSWVVILVLFFIAILMKLLYIRGGYYYVEHAVVMMLLHAKVFLVLNLIMAGGILIPNADSDTVENFMYIIYAVAALYLLLTMKIYYQQGWFKTIIKYGIVGISYIISLIIFMVIVSLIGAAMF